MKSGLSVRILLLCCIITYLGIEGYDGKWNMPILAWQLVGLFVGSPLIKILSGSVLLCWFYLCAILLKVTLLKETTVLTDRLVVAFGGLYLLALFYGYDQIKVYSTLGHINISLLFYILPFALFVVSTKLLFKQLNKAKWDH